MRNVGENIRRERVMWGMSQDDLAALLGSTRDKISKTETGVREPTNAELVAMAAVFQVSVDELLHGPSQIVYHRIEPGRPEVEEARRWLDAAIDNSLFVRRVTSSAR